MPVLRAAISGGRVATLRSAQLLQHTEAVVVVVALVLRLQVLADAEAASVRRVLQHPAEALMALAAAATAALLPESVP